MLDLWHVSFTVSNLENSVSFYREILGFEVIHQQEQKNLYTSKLVGYENAHLKVAMLGIPNKKMKYSGHLLELIEYVNPKGVHLDTQPCNVGSPHIALVVENLIEKVKGMKEKGVVFRSEPVEITAGRNKGGFSVYFQDPDSIVLEFVQPPVMK